MTLLDYARTYIARGWSVFPLVPGTKRPAVELRPFLTGERRLSDDEVGAWWDTERASQVYGIGIICGRPSGGLVVVDVDPRNGGDIETVARELSTAPFVMTGGDGAHFYCTAMPISKGKTARPGVDRQSTGSYVVAPPSVHPSGRAYTWAANERADLPLCPAWVLASPEPAATLAYDEMGGPWVARALADPSACAPGTQEETLTRLAWWAAGHLDRDIAEAVLGRWASCLTLGNPRQPWTSEHVRQKLDAAFAKREPGFVVQGTSSAAEGGSPGQPPLACPASAGSPLALLEFPEQKWIVQDFVAPGAFTEVIGKVKKGKSTLVYQMIRSVVQGSEFLGRPVAAGPVVLATEQSGSSLRATIERSGLPLDAPVFVVQKPGIAALGSWSKAVEYMTDVAVWLGSQVIVVDTLSRLARLHGDTENTSGAVSVLDPFERARSLGIACVFVRHARKGVSGEVDDIADAARGSSAITGDMDVVIRLRPHGESDLRVLSWESRITDDPEDLALEYVDGRYQVVDMPESRTRANESKRVAEMRAAVAEVGTATAALRAKLGWSQHTVEKYRRLVEEGEPLPAPPAEGSVSFGGRR